MPTDSFDTINEYFKHLGKITQDIDRDEMNALWKKIKKGNAQAKNRMMEINLRLVIPTAKRFYRPGMDLMDLIEEGNLGLMQAIEKFEPAKGYRFSTYAVYWIEQYIRKYIEEQSGSIKIPSHAWGNLKKWFKVWNDLKETNGRDPSLSEMAKELNLSARKVKAIMDTLNAAVGVESLTSLVGEEDELTLEEVLSDDGKGNPHEAILRTENINLLQENLMKLNDRDREVLSMRYGLIDNEPKTLGEVADHLGLSRERVRQIEERAVRMMRQAAQKAGLLEMQEVNKRTRNLHSGMLMQRHVKTNILGEITDQGPYIRALQRKAVRQAKSKKVQKKTAVKKQKAKTKKKKSAK